MSAGFRLMNRTPASTVAACVALALGALQPQIASADLTRTSEFNIAPQSLRDALLQYSRQSGVQVTSADAIIQPKNSFGVSGELDARKALEILLKGTDLSYEVIGANTVTIRSVPQRNGAFSTTATSTSTTSSSIRLVRAEEQASAATGAASEAASAPRNESGTADAEASSPVVLQEVIVTGSHIRGVQSSSSPVQSFDRNEIERGGFATLPEFIQSLPQNFSGGISELNVGMTPFLGNGGSGNWNYGTGVNLRGLGNKSTLTLINGRRMSTAGGGSYADISMIPLTAIERVEVLTDGASAIYGSDAVAGAVNFQMRKNYDGSETRLRYGAATEGGLDEVQLGHTIGRAWGSGYAMLSYEFAKRERLDANDRTYARAAPDPYDLVRPEVRHGAYLSAGQSLGDRVELFADIFYSKRDSETSTFGYETPPLPRKSVVENEQYGASIGGTLQLGSGWQAELVGSYSGNEALGQTYLFEAGTPASESPNESSIASLDLKADGSMFMLPGGEMKAAIGANFRHETFKDALALKDFGVPVDMNRDIFAAFAEVFVPVVGESNQLPAVRRIELTLAGRYERYSDFGSSWDPKLGLLWSPIEGVALRGTYGTSFRAPLLNELSLLFSQGLLIELPDPAAADGSTLAMIGFGQRADLGPETATTWTAGADLSFESLPGLSIALTYFDIDFRDRIASTFAFSDALTNPRYRSLLIHDPDPDFLRFWGSGPFSGKIGTTADYEDAKVFVDNRTRNTASVLTRGLDVTIGYDLRTQYGDWRFSMSGTKLFGQEEALLPGDPALDIVDTVFNPAGLKAKAAISWRLGRLASNVAVNYVGDYRDDRVAPAARVGSWTTVDLNAGYEIGDQAALLLRNTSVTLSLQNVADKDPPFVAPYLTSLPVYFDANNANPFGRTFALQATKRW